MKKLLLIIGISSIAILAKAQIEASNLPNVTLGTNETLLGVHSTLAAQTTMPNLGPVIAPFIPFSSLGGTLPATSSLTNSSTIGWRIAATNIIVTLSGNTQTNYLIQPYITNGFTGIVTNLVSVSVSNRVYYSGGTITNVTQP